MPLVSRLTAAGGAALALGAIGATASVASAAPAHHPAKKHRAQQHGSHGAPAAVFVQSDNLNGNTVVAYDRSPSGKLSRAGVFPTGGKGGALAGSAVDHLASQDSLVLDRAHDLIYAVNAGSNTVTVFGVHGDKLTRQQVVPSGGTFPVSVAVRGDTVYVLNVRSGGSVQGFHLRNGKLAPITGAHRALGLDPNATPEFTSTPGTVLLSPNGSQLLVLTKGDGSAIDAFGVRRDGALSAKPVVNAEPNAAPFAGVFDARGHLLVTEAGPSAAASFSLARGGQLTGIASTPTGQMATCWIALSGTNVYLGNAGSATVSHFEVGGDGSLRAVGTTPTDPGTVDSAVSPDGKFLYTQTGGRGIVDEFAIAKDGSLRQLGSVTVPGAVGGEGIAVS